MELKGLVDRWPMLLCMVQVVGLAGLGVAVIVRYEGKKGAGRKGEIDEREMDRDHLCVACCRGNLHPGWLLGFRAASFAYLLPLLLYNVITDGPFVFFFYTQWTFSLLIAYFGIAVYVSSKGLRQHHIKEISFVKSHASESRSAEDVEDCVMVDESGQAGSQAPLITGLQRKNTPRQLLEHVMQIIFQVVVPAVLVTDAVYWLIIVPFFLSKVFKENFLNVNMHGVNAILLLGEFSLNSMSFPWFGVGYFVLWSVLYVISQWFLHLIGFKWWPYPFLDVSTPWAPLWYLGLAALHLACFSLCLGLAMLKNSITRCVLPMDGLVENGPAKT